MNIFFLNLQEKIFNLYLHNIKNEKNWFSNVSNVVSIIILKKNKIYIWNKVYSIEVYECKVLHSQENHRWVDKCCIKCSKNFLSFLCIKQFSRKVSWKQWSKPTVEENVKPQAQKYSLVKLHIFQIKRSLTIMEENKHKSSLF